MVTVNRGVFRTHSNIYGRVFFAKIVNGYKPLSIFAKTLHCRSSAGINKDTRAISIKIDNKDTRAIS